MDRYTVPTRYWHALDDGRVQCDVCPRAASCARGSAGSASCAPARTTASCSRPTAARAGSASTRSRRSRSTTSCPARRCCRSARPAATSPAGSARTGTSRSRARSTRSPTRPRPDTIARRRRRPRLPQRRVHVQRPGRSSSSTRSTSPTACRERGDPDRRGHRRLRSAREPRAEFFRAHGRRQRRPQGVHRAILPRAVRAPTCSRCSTRWSTSSHETDVWLEITTLLIPGENDSDDELDAMTAWVVEQLGPDVPMHFTPSTRTRMRDRRRRRRRPSTRARRSRAATASATPTPATSTTATATARSATGAATRSSSATGTTRRAEPGRRPVAARVWRGVRGRLRRPPRHVGASPSPGPARGGDADQDPGAAAPHKTAAPTGGTQQDPVGTSPHPPAGRRRHLLRRRSR